MPRHEFIVESVINGTSAQQLWDYHNTQGIFSRIQPPWEKIDVQLAPDKLLEGSQVRFHLHKGPFSIAWHALHEDVQPGIGFADRQIKGPFSYWRHEHVFKQSGNNCTLRDKIKFKLPFEPFTSLGVASVRKRLRRMFDYRHRITTMDLERHFTVFAGAPPRTLRVAITGMTGLIGSSLATFLRWRGHEVVGITRQSTEGWIQWDPDNGVLNPNDLEGVDAVIHLAGENLAQGRWTERRKQRILASRVRSTQLLVSTFAKMQHPPQTFICASGIHAGQPGFLGQVCNAWEAASLDLDTNTTRRVLMRLGVVLHPSGGALAKMLPAFRCGLGGPLGSGKQRMPWISLEDAVDIFTLALEQDDFTGAVEVVAPQELTQAQLAKALGTTLRRPSFVPLPALAVKLLFGQMGEETILGDCVATPTVLTARNYSFRWPIAESLLAHLFATKLRNSK